jgi:tRNA (guanine26-N2/guanine27-N2)-dimethyltransferase
LSAATATQTRVDRTESRWSQQLNSNNKQGTMDVTTEDVTVEEVPVEMDGGKLAEIREGSVVMLYDQSEAVFYNKIMVFNRDFSIQVISLFSEIVRDERRAKYEKSLARYEQLMVEATTPNSAAGKPKEALRPPRQPPAGITILDALAATGLRSVRYLKEIPGCSHVTINDLDPAAVTAAAENCRANGVESSRFSTHQGDASLFMYNNKEIERQFDVIDLDPYGTASPFLDSAVQAVRDGGLLCITCTDMPTLSGNYPEVCFAKYGCMPFKARYHHEMSLRILLHAIDACANKYKRHIVPWLSLSVDYYVRVFVRVFESPAEVKKSSLRRGYVFQSAQCASYYVQPAGKVTANNAGYTTPHIIAPAVCEETGGGMKIGGPFWTAPIHDQAIVDRLLARVSAIGSSSSNSSSSAAVGVFPVATVNRILGVLACISEELKDVVLYYILPDLFAAVRSGTPTNEQFISALLNAGYRVSQFHHEPTSIKTDAPPNVVRSTPTMSFIISCQK